MHAGLAATAALLAVFALPAAAQVGANAPAYPSRPVRLVVPFAPAGPNDFLARALGQKLADTWGQPVVIDNRGGAGGTVGTELGLRAPADGHTLIMGGASTLTVAPGLYAKLPYDPARDVTPIVNIARVPYVLGVHPGVAAKSLADLIAAARARPGTLTYGSSGTGSMSNLAAEMLKRLANVDIVHVPYKGTAPAITDVIGGQISMMLADLAVIMPHARSGRMRALAVSGTARSATAPEVPTIAESGLPGYSLNVWFGLVAPAGLAQPIVAKISSDSVQALRTPDMIERLARQGYEPIADAAPEFAAYLRSELPRMTQFIREAGLRAE